MSIRAFVINSFRCHLQKVQTPKSMKPTSVFLGLLMTASCASAQDVWNGRVYDLHAQTQISQAELTKRLVKADIVVLGEKHYHTETQQAQGQIIDMVMKADPKKSFTTNWEFLNYTAQSVTDILHDRYMKNVINEDEFMELALGHKRAVAYSPILKMTRAHGGRFLGVNLSREEKAPAVEKGLSGMDPALVPPGFALGGADYFKRFHEAMAAHAPTPEKLQNYYVAQCLTDDAMAYHIAEHTGTERNFLITGSFHMEYNDGVVTRLKARLPGKQVVTVRILDTSDYIEEELDGLIKDKSYGPTADYLMFVEEPFVAQKP